MLTVFAIATLPILFGLLFVSGIPLTPMAVWMVPIIVLQYLFTLALGFFVAAIHVRFRDTQYILGIFLMLGFFMTPILYEISIVPEQYLPIYELNPMARLVDAYRAVLLRAELPDLASLGVLSAGTLILFVIGHRTFQRASVRFAEEI